MCIYLWRNLSIENVFQICGLAIKFQQEMLIHLCQAAIVSNMPGILESDGFLNCKAELLDFMLENMEFGCSEVRVFEAVMSWVQRKSKSKLTKDTVETHLGSLLYKIQFKSMEATEFESLKKSYDYTFTEKDADTIEEMIKDREEKFPFKTNRKNVFGGHDWNDELQRKCDRYVDMSSNNETPYKIPNGIIVFGIYF